MTPIEAREWQSYNFSPNDAANWKRAGFAPLVARTWSDKGFDADEAREWINSSKNNRSLMADLDQSISRDLGVLDWGRGVWTYRNTWYWASASGFIDGEAFGFNFGYGFSDRRPASENLLLYRGRAHKLDQIIFYFDRHDWLKPWRISSNDGRVELEFIPRVDRNSHFNALLIASEQHQVFGHYRGHVTLDNGQVLQLGHLPGFAEEVRNRW